MGSWLTRAREERAYPVIYLAKYFETRGPLPPTISVCYELLICSKRGKVEQIVVLLYVFKIRRGLSPFKRGIISMGRNGVGNCTLPLLQHIPGLSPGNLSALQ